MKIKSYIEKVNNLSQQKDLRLYDFLLPMGTIVAVLCDDDEKIVLLEANGKGGINKHIFPNGVSFKCMPKIKNKEKISLLNRLLGLFKK